MIEGRVVKLQMKKMLLKGIYLEKDTYTCRVVSYDIQEEKILMSIEDGYLAKLSLDAEYECVIYLEDKILRCEGVIKERYQNEDGNMALFLVEKGFYEK